MVAAARTTPPLPHRPREKARTTRSHTGPLRVRARRELPDVLPTAVVRFWAWLGIAAQRLKARCSAAADGPPSISHEALAWRFRSGDEREHCMRHPPGTVGVSPSRLRSRDSLRAPPAATRLHVACNGVWCLFPPIRARTWCQRVLRGRSAARESQEHLNSHERKSMCLVIGKKFLVPCAHHTVCVP